MYEMYAEPFNSFLTKNNIELKFPGTACWRGYYGTWEIRDRKLFLTNIKAYLNYNNIVGVEYFFSWKKCVLADWFTGTLNIKTRKIPYPFSVIESMKFLRELHVDIENGIIVGETAITG